CDTFLFGPGMGGRVHVDALTRAVIDKPRPDLSLLLDAAPLACAAGLETLIAAHDGRAVMTPHYGELAYLIGSTDSRIADAAAHRLGPLGFLARDLLEHLPRLLAIG